MKEAGAHSEYKGAIIRAKASDRVFTVCFQDGWSNVPHRVLGTPTFEKWEAAGCPPAGNIVATNPVTGLKRRYDAAGPQPDDRGTIRAQFVIFRRHGELSRSLCKECLAGS